jgi:hypothetical protein
MIDSKRSCLDIALEGQHFTRLFIVILLRFAGEPVSSLEKLDVELLMARPLQVDRLRFKVASQPPVLLP